MGLTKCGRGKGQPGHPCLQGVLICGEKMNDHVEIIGQWKITLSLPCPQTQDSG